MKPAQAAQFAALIGIDWAHAKHDICLQPGTHAAREHSVLKHTPEAIDAWVRELRQRFGKQPIAIALELDKGPLVYALQKYDGFVLFPVNPNLLAKYREAFTPSKAKDDPTDAELALELLVRHREALTCLTPQSAPMRALIQLVHDRRRLVHDRVRVSNRLTNTLKNYFPQALDWFPDKATVVFCDFLSRWPTLKQARRARKTALQAFFREHNVRYPQVITQRIDAIRSAMPLTEDPAIIQPQALLVSALVAQLRTVLAAIEQFDSAIADNLQPAPRLRLVPQPARRRPGARAAPAGRLRRRPRALSQRQRDPAVRRHRPRHRTQRPEVLGTLALPRPQLPAPELRRVGRGNHPALVLGQSLLPAATRQGVGAPGRRARTRFQMDPDRVPLLAGSNAL